MSAHALVTLPEEGRNRGVAGMMIKAFHANRPTLPGWIWSDGIFWGSGVDPHDGLPTDRVRRHTMGTFNKAKAA
jgi:hypothetical protein